MATVTKPIALDESLNTTELSSRNVADVLAQELARIAGKQASDVEYDNTASGLMADNVQGAIDELKSDIPTVNDGTLTIQQNGETKGTFTANQSGNSTVNIETPTTDIQTAVDEFSTYNGGLLSECKVALSPNQDLHGYDHPWVGGAGKNEIDSSSFRDEFLSGGVTFTKISDSHYKANGTADSTSWLQVRQTGDYNIDANLPTGTYTLSCKPFNKLVPYIYRGENYTDYVYDASGKVTSTNMPVTGIRILIPKDTVFDNEDVYLQLEEGSTVTDWTPYSNICPISGHTEVDLYNVGKNRCSFWKNGYMNSSGVFVSSNVNGMSNIIPLKNGEKIIYSSSIVGSGTGLSVFANSDLTSMLTRKNAWDTLGTPSYITYTATSDCYAVVWFNLDNATTVTQDIYNSVQLQIEFVTSSVITPTSYEPYLGHLYQVQIGSTVYGGTVDLVSGVMVATHAFMTFDGTENWQIGSGNAYLGIVGMKSGNNQWGLCSILPRGTESGCIRFGYTNTRIYIMDCITAYELDTATKVKAFMNGAEIVYPLDTPQTIQLTPQQIEALVGQNNLSTPLEGQSIDSVKYREVFAFDDVEKVVSLRVPISMLGTDESGRTTASQSYASGDYFYKDGYMCKALTSISAGATLTLNTNYSQGTLADILKAIENA